MTTTTKITAMFNHWRPRERYHLHPHHDRHRVGAAPEYDDCISVLDFRSKKGQNKQNFAGGTPAVKIKTQPTHHNYLSSFPMTKTPPPADGQALERKPSAPRVLLTGRLIVVDATVSEDDPEIYEAAFTFYKFCTDVWETISSDESEAGDSGARSPFRRMEPIATSQAMPVYPVQHFPYPSLPPSAAFPYPSLPPSASPQKTPPFAPMAVSSFTAVNGRPNHHLHRHSSVVASIGMPWPIHTSQRLPSNHSVSISLSPQAPRLGSPPKPLEAPNLPPPPYPAFNQVSPQHLNSMRPNQPSQTKINQALLAKHSKDVARQREGLGTNQKGGTLMFSIRQHNANTKARAAVYRTTPAIESSPNMNEPPPHFRINPQPMNASTVFSTKPNLAFQRFNPNEHRFEPQIQNSADNGTYHRFRMSKARFPPTNDNFRYMDLTQDDD